MDEVERKFEKLKKFIPLLEKLSNQFKSQAENSFKNAVSEKHKKITYLLNLLKSGFNR